METLWLGRVPRASQGLRIGANDIVDARRRILLQLAKSCSNLDQGGNPLTIISKAEGSTSLNGTAEGVDEAELNAGLVMPTYKGNRAMSRKGHQRAASSQHHNILPTIVECSESPTKPATVQWEGNVEQREEKCKASGMEGQTSRRVRTSSLDGVALGDPTGGQGAQVRTSSLDGIAMGDGIVGKRYRRGRTASAEGVTVGEGRSQRKRAPSSRSFDAREGDHWNPKLV